jgi:hypothetical protein
MELVMREPIGYWLKELDRLIEAEFARTLDEADVSRREWQVLASLPVAAAELDQLLAAFVPDGAGPVVEKLRARGWVDRADDLVVLTADGAAARAAITVSVKCIRERSAEGVSAEDYATTVGTLVRMAQNLS